MTDSKIFLDTSPFIYFIEGCESNPEYYDKMKSFFQKAVDENCRFATSAVTVEEYLTFPFKNGQEQLESAFKETLNVFNIEVININYAIAREAAKIRSEFLGFKGMDSLQIAAAKYSDCDIFLTNDKQLLQFNRMNFLTVDEMV